MFGGVNYQFWNVKMKIFIESIDWGIWDAGVNGLFMPKHMMNDELVDRPWLEWSGIEKKIVQYDCMTKKHNYFCFECWWLVRVSQFTFAMEMWDILEVTH